MNDGRTICSKHYYIYSWTKQNTVIMHNYIYIYIYIAIAIYLYIYIYKCIHACMCIYMQNFMYEQYMDVKYVM